VITIPVQKPWNVKTPSVIRYLDKGHVDVFFETGELRLSSFARFAKHPDEQRGDSSEGTSIINCFTADGKTLFAVTKHGFDSYVLCGSTIESTQLQRQFGCSSYFRILDTTQFGIAVAAAIPGFKGGVEGLCIYQESRVIQKESPPFSEVADLNKKGDPIDMNKLFNYVSSAAGVDVVLVKLRRFSHQSEYRFIWATNAELGETITIHAPNARQFCQRPDDARPASESKCPAPDDRSEARPNVPVAD
jgi:hypothetical protein